MTGRWCATALLLLAACGGEGTAPGDRTPLGVFDQVVREFDARYPTFAIKGLDWRALAATHRANLNASSTESALFAELSSLLGELRDVHVRLITPIGTYQYRAWLDRPVNFDASIVQSGYLQSAPRSTASGRIAWGRIGATGYIRVASLSGSGWGGDIEEALDSLRAASALVLDLRGNGGGNDAIASDIAARFVSASRVYSRIRVRNGPLYSDLGPFTDRTIAPGGTRRFAGKLVVLTSRGVFSSAESFVLMLRQVPGAIAVGDTTGGGSANPMEVTLANGWTVWISRWVEYPPTGETFEGKGIAPDVPVWISPADAARGHDTILDSALARLSAGMVRRSLPLSWSAQ